MKNALSHCNEGCTARVAEKGKAEDVLYYIRVPFRESSTPVQPQTQEWTCGRPDLMKDQQPRRRAVERSVGCTTQRQLQRRRRWELLGMRCGRHEKPLPQPPPGPGPGQTVWRGEAVRPRGPRGDPTPSLHRSPTFFYLFIFLECLVTEKKKKPLRAFVLSPESVDLHKAVGADKTVCCSNTGGLDVVAHACLVLAFRASLMGDSLTLTKPSGPPTFASFG